jgi:hypothetical protein
MDPNPLAPTSSDARLAGGLMSVVQQLQKNRFGGLRELQGSPIGAEAKGSAVLDALSKNKQQNGQGQNAAPTLGALQEDRGQEQGRQRNVGQRETQGRFGKSPQV